VKVPQDRCGQTPCFPTGGEALGQPLFGGAHQAGEGHALFATQPAGEGRPLVRGGFTEVPEQVGARNDQDLPGMVTRQASPLPVLAFLTAEAAEKTRFEEDAVVLAPHDAFAGVIEPEPQFVVEPVLPAA
jgi:hypothetical protein